MIQDNKNISISIPQLTINLSPLGFYIYAEEFYTVAEQYKPKTDAFSPVPYYLYCHSIELSFKAFLLTQGFTQKEARKSAGNNGHYLDELLQKVQELGIEKLIELNDEEKKCIELANNYYAKKGFEYFKVVKAVKGYQELPDINILKLLSKKLLDNLRVPCENA